MTIGDILECLNSIMGATEAMEVKGKQNAALLCYIYDRAEALANALKEEAQKIQNGSVATTEPEIEVTEVGDENGQQNRESA